LQPNPDDQSELAGDVAIKLLGGRQPLLLELRLMPIAVADDHGIGRRGLHG